MQGLLSSIQEQIRQRDLFGVPVQLTYKGERTFNTAYGGCCSILLVLGLCTYFIFEVQRSYLEPTFLSTPPSIDYSQ